MTLPLPFDSVAPAVTTPTPVAIVLSTFNGVAFLPAQLDSIVAQEGVLWRLYWRDDGSSDGSVAVMERFEAAAGANRCVRIDTRGRLGVTASYMTLLRHVVADGAMIVAFADQDDVWMPQKLLRSLDQLGCVDQVATSETPTLYCSRQVLVDGELRRLCDSAPVHVRPGLGPALTQNIATGCTVVMNRAAAALVASTTPPSCSLHDWWSYLVVAASGGRIIADEEKTVLYRQHGSNAVGAPPSTSRRAVAALRRGPRIFMTVFRGHVTGLLAHPWLLSPEAKRTLDAVARSLAGGPLERVTMFGHRLRRQTWPETVLFRCWFLVG
jgi:glycosyltransferase involved in cell wall biosynthesis